MSETKAFRVVRRHIGDQPYEVGSIRTGSMHDLGHLIPHVLQPIDGSADAPLDNKAEGAAPATKAVKGRKAATKAQRAENGE